MILGRPVLAGVAELAEVSWQVWTFCWPWPWRASRGVSRSHGDGSSIQIPMDNQFLSSSCHSAKSPEVGDIERSRQRIKMDESMELIGRCHTISPLKVVSLGRQNPVGQSHRLPISSRRPICMTHQGIHCLDQSNHVSPVFCATFQDDP